MQGGQSPQGQASMQGGQSTQGQASMQGGQSTQGQASMQRNQQGQTSMASMHNITQSPAGEQTAGNMLLQQSYPSGMGQSFPSGMSGQMTLSGNQGGQGAQNQSGQSNMQNRSSISGQNAQNQGTQMNAASGQGSPSAMSNAQIGQTVFKNSENEYREEPHAQHYPYNRYTT